MGNSTTPSIKPQNECDVITIFPMGVNCVIRNPSNDKTFDGAAALVITGGTPPYTIYWEVGSYAPALDDLGIGQYSATVVDSYGDFTANTTCVLTAETLTISGMCFVVSGIAEDQLVYISAQGLTLKNGKPYYFLQYATQQIGYVFWDVVTNQWVFCETLDCQNINPYNTNSGDGFYPTGNTGDWVVIADTNIEIVESYVGSCSLPIIPKELYDLCVSIEVKEGGRDVVYVSVVNIDLSPGNTINGEPSWTSDTSQYLLYWNNTSTPNQWTLTGFSQTTNFINNDSSYPPLSNWQILGDPSVTSISVITGNCSDEYTIFVSATDNDAPCNEGTGSITVTANGGVTPYQYSIDGGQSYVASPIFNNLIPGIYMVMAKDSNNVIGSFGNVTISTTPATTYTLTLNVNYNANTFTITAPTLPGGVTLTADLNMLSLLTYYPATIIPAPSYNNTTTINGSTTMTLNNVTTNTITVNNPCFQEVQSGVTAVQVQKTYNSTLVFTSNQTITGSTTNTIVNDPFNKCQNAVAYYTLSLSNPLVSGCVCCNLNLINPVQPLPPIV
jgi:hypothetical protein